MSPEMLLIVIVAVLGALSIGVAAAGGGSSQARRLERRLAVVERKLDRMLDHLGVPAPEDPFPEVEALLSRDRKIQAIKVYREDTGADLREAKDAVERLAGER